MKTKLLGLMLLAGSSLFAETHFSIGIGIGTPYYYAPPAPPVVAYRPPCPGPEYSWVPGYWYPAGPRYAWRAGFWARPPYAGAYWVGPRYYEGRYYSGYWGGERRWDRDDDERWEHHWDGDDERWEHHDRGEHRGWYRRHDD